VAKPLRFWEKLIIISLLPTPAPSLSFFPLSSLRSYLPLLLLLPSSSTPMSVHVDSPRREDPVETKQRVEVW
jgi:hypothetical protein